MDPTFKSSLSMRSIRFVTFLHLLVVVHTNVAELRPDEPQDNSFVFHDSRQGQLRTFHIIAYMNLLLALIKAENIIVTKEK